MPLNELSQARGLSQKTLAVLLHVQQPSIAKMESASTCISHSLLQKAKTPEIL